MFKAIIGVYGHNVVPTIFIIYWNIVYGNLVIVDYLCRSYVVYTVVVYWERFLPQACNYRNRHRYGCPKRCTDYIYWSWLLSIEQSISDTVLAWQAVYVTWIQVRLRDSDACCLEILLSKNVTKVELGLRIAMQVPMNEEKPNVKCQWRKPNADHNSMKGGTATMRPVYAILLKKLFHYFW